MKIIKFASIKNTSQEISIYMIRLDRINKFYTQTCSNKFFKRKKLRQGPPYLAVFTLQTKSTLYIHSEELPL